MKVDTIKAYASHFAHGLMFHRFHKSGNPAVGRGSVTEVEFEQILNYVGIKRILSAQEWLWRVKTESLRTDDLCITFDDGLKSQFDVVLPILDRYGIKAFWFVFSSVFDGEIDKNEVYNRFASTAFTSFDKFVDEFLRVCLLCNKDFQNGDYEHFVQASKNQFPFYSENDIKFRFARNKILTRDEFEQAVDTMIKSKGLSVLNLADNIWLSDEQLKYLNSSGHYIGLHSFNHPFDMAALSIKKQEEQYARNHKHIQRVTGCIVESMSHPLNSYSEDTLVILKKMGINCGFRSNMISPVSKCVNATNLELAREDGVNLLGMLV